MEGAVRAETGIAALAVEALGAGPAQDLEHLGHRLIGRFQSIDDAGGPQRVEELERPLRPIEAPAHGAIDVDQVVGDLGDQSGGVAQGPAHYVPGEPALRDVVEQ